MSTPGAGETRPRRCIPIIDVFAGPGGLGEGFSSVRHADGGRAFELLLSIEKDEVAHRTLTLRSALRAFDDGKIPDVYYDYVRGRIDRESLHSSPAFAAAHQHSLEEARCIELGPASHQVVDERIRQVLSSRGDWILIGGPPCQAYSLAGRSRVRLADRPKFENDERHLLYTEYLRIIAKFAPAIFVMENVKGLLSSKHLGTSIFDRILKDLSAPAHDLEYTIHSLVEKSEPASSRRPDFVIRSERFGIPQARHRVILLGVRKGFSLTPPDILAESNLKPSVRSVIGDLPEMRSRLSRERDDFDSWLESLSGLKTRIRADLKQSPRLASAVDSALTIAQSHRNVGGRFIPVDAGRNPPEFAGGAELWKWFHDPKLGGFLHHESRSHMRSDLERYLFVSAYGKEFGHSPNLKAFPSALLPKHENVADENPPFLDRFRVQCWDDPSTTVVSHISKDGHYYIHPDPSQCRSLTVREAARLQTFPDNYFFEGNRTEQYHQVGNAVPPWLARQIGQIVLRLCDAAAAESCSRPRSQAETLSTVA